jgi:membrane associated rhomboid family serine protease
MRSTFDRPSNFISGSSIPPVTKWLLISNLAIWVIFFFAVRAGFGGYFFDLQLVPAQVISHFAIWQLVTWMFLHDPDGIMHIFFNMLMLWQIGSLLESTWGSDRFLRFYFICGVGSGICVVLAKLLFGGEGVPVIGASGAIYGLLMAFGYLFPRQRVVFYFFPIEARWMVWIMGAIAFFSALGASGDSVSHLAHLGGLAVGFLVMKQWEANPRGRPSLRPAVSPLQRLQDWYKEFRLRRAKRKFEAYMRNNRRDI